MNIAFVDAFKIHDFDDDGKISMQDLKLYLQLVTDFGDLDDEKLEESIDVVVSRTMEEASSDGMALSFDDFVKVGSHRIRISWES